MDEEEVALEVVEVVKLVVEVELETTARVVDVVGTGVEDEDEDVLLVTTDVVVVAATAEVEVVRTEVVEETTTADVLVDARAAAQAAFAAERTARASVAPHAERIQAVAAP